MHYEGKKQKIIISFGLRRQLLRTSGQFATKADIDFTKRLGPNKSHNGTLWILDPSNASNLITVIQLDLS